MSHRVLGVFTWHRALAGAVALSCTLSVACTPDDPPPEKLTEYYAQIEARHFRTPEGDVAIPFDLTIGRRIRADLPRPYETAGSLAATHVRLLGEPKVSARQKRLARLVLASSPLATRHILAKRLWRSSDITVRRQVASVLASADGITASELFKAGPELNDPVTLLALMVKTGHTYGAPPQYFRKIDDPVTDAVSKHWRDWLSNEWPKLQKKTRSQRGELEVAAIKKLWESPKTRLEAWKRFCCCRALDITTFEELVKIPEARRGELVLGQFARNLWSATYPSYGP